MWPSGMKDYSLLVVAEEMRGTAERRSLQRLKWQTRKELCFSYRNLVRAGVNLISKPDSRAMAFVSNSAGMSLWFEQFFQGSWWGEA